MTLGQLQKIEAARKRGISKRGNTVKVRGPGKLIGWYLSAPTPLLIGGALALGVAFALIGLPGLLLFLIPLLLLRGKAAKSLQCMAQQAQHATTVATQHDSISIPLTKVMQQLRQAEKFSPAPLLGMVFCSGIFLWITRDLGMGNYMLFGAVALIICGFGFLSSYQESRRAHERLQSYSVDEVPTLDIDAQGMTVPFLLIPRNDSNYAYLAASGEKTLRVKWDTIQSWKYIDNENEESYYQLVLVDQSLPQVPKLRIACGALSFEDRLLLINFAERFVKAPMPLSFMKANSAPVTS